MSAPARGHQHPREGSRSISTATSSSSVHANRLRGRRSRPEVLERRPDNVTDVEDANRLLECSQVARQLRFQHVVRHYLSQILHGCKSAFCDTPTCLSCNRRNALRPTRPPTQLTARALAHHLASQDDPHRGLCPHELRVPPASWEIDGAIGTSLRQASDGDWLYSVYPAASRLIHQSLVGSVHERHQAKKDAKSLSQNLFDAVTVIYSYSKQLPSPAAVVDVIRSQPSIHPAPAAVRTNGKPVTHQTHSSTSVAREHSQQDRHASQTTSEVLTNGQQIHKIPYALRTSRGQSKTNKLVGQTSLNGTPDLPLLVKKSRKEDSMLAEPTMAQNKIKNSTIRSNPAIPVVSRLNCTTLEELKNEVYHHRKDLSPDLFNFVVDYDSNRRFRPSKPFVNRSLFYTLSDPETLLKSFHDNNNAFASSPLPHLDSARLTHCFKDWDRRNGALIFDSLWVAAEALFVAPPELDVQKSPRLRPSRKGALRDTPAEQSSHGATTATPRYLSDLEAAHIVIICVHALTSLVSNGWSHTWTQLRKLRSWGVIIPNAAPNTDEFSHPYINIVDELEYEPAIRLTDRLLRGIGARTCFEHILRSLGRKEDRESMHISSNVTLVDLVVEHLEVVERVAQASRRRITSTTYSSEDPGWTVTSIFVEWVKTIIIKKWDCKANINKWSSVGTAVRLLDRFHQSHGSLNLRSYMFELPFFNEHLDAVDEPLRFLQWEEQPNVFHIFRYPNLFPAQYCVRYFRTINLNSMMTQYDHTTRTQQMHRSLQMFLREPHWFMVKRRMNVSLSNYLVLDVTREDPLKDTLDQLWGLEKRMLQKPLKVKMGQHEGEVGADHGGVTYEFFRVVLSEAFKPDHGMFTQDSHTRMTWFQPSTLEPDWKFEMMGLLFSLAVYNGITLPVTFPLALYRYLLPPEAPLRDRDMATDSLDFIKDGWPELAKHFETLLTWDDGDVEHVMTRDYAFSYDAFGQHIDHNMEEPYIRSQHLTPMPDIPTKEPKPVTNANREQFVRDYIHHLTYLSVEPQLNAFGKGFLACLHPKSLHLFTPHTLRKLIEGEQQISIPDLRRCARYEAGFSATHPTILDFWSVVERYNQDDCRHLLEFVTASDRVPVMGYEGITFHVSRYGDDTDMLPTSSTCFGKLYLPEYKDKESLRRKLELAIRNSKGFGVV